MPNTLGHAAPVPLLVRHSRSAVADLSSNASACDQLALHESQVIQMSTRYINSTAPLALLLIAVVAIISIGRAAPLRRAPRPLLLSESRRHARPDPHAADWQHRRAHIIAGMEEVMGPLPRPETPVPLDVQVVEEHQGDGFIRRKLAYHTDDPNKRVRAWLLLPLPPGEGRGEGALPAAPQRRPAMLCLHQTTPNGKDSPVGLADRPTLHYALELAQARLRHALARLPVVRRIPTTTSTPTTTPAAR